jgi:opacity protein-like surface antigen
MTKWTLVGAALLATSLASPALAQAVVEDPGFCAQFYPNANCQNYGPGNPLYSDQGPYHGQYAGYGRMHMHAWHHRYRHHHHG